MRCQSDLENPFKRIMHFTARKCILPLKLLSIVIIYCLVVLIGGLMDFRTARVMTEDLKRFQEESTKRESA